MVVPYRTASEGSWSSFFIVTPQVLLKRRGSIIPKVFPQVLLTISLAVVARWWNPLAEHAEDMDSGLSILGVLLSFLVVFKTHSAYGQFWDAVTQTEKMLQVSRTIVMSAATLFPFDDPGPDVSRQPSPALLEADAWAGGALRVRVIRAMALSQADSDFLGDVSDPYVVVSVGSQSFRTKTVSNCLTPVWNSDTFDVTLDEEDTAVNFEVRDSDFRAADVLGRLHLTHEDLMGLADSKWQRLRRALEDGAGAELEVELHFARYVRPCSAPRPTWRKASLEGDSDPLERLINEQSGHEQVIAFLRMAGLEACSQRLLDAGFASLDALECAEEPHLRDSGLLIAERSVLRRRLQERAEAHKSAAAPASAEPGGGGGMRDEDMPVPAFLRRIVRLVALHYFVVVEYFRRTGGNAITDKDYQDTMRRDIKMLTGEREYAMLYPDELRSTPGSQAHNQCANPMVVLYWVQLTIGTCFSVHKIPPPIVTSFVPLISGLSDTFWEMNKIDKLQFPLPYAQVVKLVCFIFVFLVPWVLQPKCQEITEIVVGLIALGFFGLDEVAEIMESPFGNDPNHIDLRSYGQDLLDDLEVMYYSREKQLDTVFNEAQATSKRRLFDSRLRGSPGSGDDAGTGYFPEKVTARLSRHELNLKTLSGDVPDLKQEGWHPLHVVPC